MSDHGTRVFSYKRTLETPISLRMLCGRAPRGGRGRLGWGSGRRIEASALHIWQIIGWGWSGKPLVTFVTKVLVQGFHWGWTHQTLLRGFRGCLLVMLFRLWMVCWRDWIGCRIVTCKYQNHAYYINWTQYTQSFNSGTLLWSFYSKLGTITSFSSQPNNNMIT